MYDLCCGLLDIMGPCKPHMIPVSQKTLNQMHDWRRENRNMESLSWEVVTSLAPLKTEGKKSGKWQKYSDGGRPKSDSKEAE